MNMYIDTEKLKTEIERLHKAHSGKYGCDEVGLNLEYLEDFIDSIQQEQPDKETILRICKLHKAWSIIAPWENVEDFVITNWNSENIV